MAKTGYAITPINWEYDDNNYNQSGSEASVKVFLSKERAEAERVKMTNSLIRGGHAASLDRYNGGEVNRNFLLDMGAIISADDDISFDRDLDAMELEILQEMTGIAFFEISEIEVDEALETR